jgi:hypothetical protein
MEAPASFRSPVAGWADVSSMYLMQGISRATEAGLGLICSAQVGSGMIARYIPDYIIRLQFGESETLVLPIARLRL